MNTVTKTRRGFSLVELLAVVLVLAVLAAVAIPLYTSQRKSAAGRTCKANITAIASVLTAQALRNGKYPADASSALPSSLTSANEGLAEIPKCPLGTSGSSGTGVYTYTSAGLTTSTAVITCPNAADHVGYGGIAGDWSKTLAAPGTDNLP